LDLRHSDGPVLTDQELKEFASHWIRAWNDHDIESIISHYSDDVEYFSGFLTRFAGNAAGTLRGKGAVKEYFAKALAAYPDLHFLLINVFRGVRSVVLQYRSVNGLTAAEVFEFNGKGLVDRVQCHYDKW
jgi:hypothetical protein